MAVTVDTDRAGWIRALRRWWPQLVDYRAAQHAWWPDSRIARAGGHLAVAFQTLNGAAASARIAAHDNHGIATTRRVLRSGAVAILAAFLGVFIALAAAAAAVAATVGLPVVLTAGATVGAAGAGVIALLWPVMSDADRHVRTGGAATRTGCWTDTHFHVAPNDRGSGHARELADAAIGAIPDDEPLVLTAATPQLLATYRRWWPQAQQLGTHQLHLPAGADRTVNTRPRQP